MADQEGIGLDLKFGPMTGVAGPARCNHVLLADKTVLTGWPGEDVECQRPAGHAADHRGPGDPHDIPGAIQWPTGASGDATR